MPCTPLPHANDLNYCSHGTYDERGLLYVGEVITQPEDLAVILTNLGSGRTDVLVPDPALLPEIVVRLPESIVPGQTYELHVKGPNVTTGIAPVPFRPYLYTLNTADFAPQAETIDGVVVTFSKMFDQDGDVHAHGDQYITLK